MALISVNNENTIVNDQVYDSIFRWANLSDLSAQFLFNAALYCKTNYMRYKQYWSNSLSA